jgi:uncharacterized membrane protein YraQ (UPF0718 family)
MSATLLAFSTLAIAGGGLAALALRSRAWGVAALKGLMGSVLGGLLLFELWPAIYARLGLPSLGFGIAGFVAVVLAERILGRGVHDHGESGRFFTAEMVWAGLLLHQLTDGLALSLSAHSEGLSSLALVVITHQVPVAAVVMWLFLARGEQLRGWQRLGLMAVATAIGTLASSSLLPLAESATLHALMAFASGTFIHLFAHDFIDFHAHDRKDKTAEFFAFLVGILAFIFFHYHGQHQHHGAGSFADHFSHLLAKSAPYLLLGLLAGGLLHAFLPESPIRWMQRGGTLGQSVKGMLFGLPLPVCSCGVIPLFTSLAKRGVPPAALISFLIATPELGIDSFLYSLSLLGLEFSLLRLAAAMVLPILAATLFVALTRRQAETGNAACGHCCKSQEGERKAWWRYAAKDLADDLFPMLLLGLALAAMVQTLWPVDLPPPIPAGWDILFLAAIGIPFYVCASASVPLALVLLERGFSLGAVLVFLFAGPATNIATILAVEKAFGKSRGLLLALICLVLAVLLGLLGNAFLTDHHFAVASQEHQHTWSLPALVSSIALAVLALGSLWRLGPLHWISTMINVLPGITHHPGKQPATR